MKQIFISYAHGDESVARELAESFRDTAVSGWMDQSDIVTGGVVALKVKESIQKASALVVLVSEASLKSQ